MSRYNYQIRLDHHLHYWVPPQSKTVTRPFRVDGQKDHTYYKNGACFIDLGATPDSPTLVSNTKRENDCDSQGSVTIKKIAI